MLWVLTLALTLLASLAPPLVPHIPHRTALALPGDGPYLHTDGAILRDVQGHAVRLSGVNWFGLETCAFAPDGLGVRSWWDLLDQVRALGFNTIRLPFSDQLLAPTSYPRYINYALNPDLRGLSGLQVMDRIIAGAGQRGLRIILDRHRPGCTAQAPLWYTRRYPERRWIADLVHLARRYRQEPAVIGIDLHNEPHGRATWGDGNPTTDWRLAAERAGNAVLRANPHLLIVVGGAQTYHGDNYWWGGNLEGAATAPVRLAVPHRLVYEAHDYGPGVYSQAWFSAPDFPRNLPDLWRRHWAYLEESDTAPVLLGEFGGRSIALPHGPLVMRAAARTADDPPALTRAQVEEGIWQRTLIRYLAHHPAISFMYWSLTPDSSDTGGLLNDDWQTANSTKEVLLRGIQGAALPLPHAQPAPAPLRVLASDVVEPGGNQQALTLQIVNDGPRPFHLAHAELRYWWHRPRLLTATSTSVSPTATVTATPTHTAGTLVSTPGQQRQANVDWASTGANTVVTATGAMRGYAFVALRFAAMTPALEALAPYGGVATVIVRLHRADWAPYPPDHDWSYAPSAMPVPAPRLTLAVAGRPVWGTSPVDQDHAKEKVR
jgi:endoglucanase